MYPHARLASSQREQSDADSRGSDRKENKKGYMNMNGARKLAPAIPWIKG